ncbi:ribosomal protein S18-alanine N-acetyltransferase [Elusimicrobiota bacterium]
MNLKIEKLEKKHINAVLEIEQLSFADPWNKGMFEKEIKLGVSNFFIFELQDKIIGYGGFWDFSDEADIVNLAVHPDYRSKGVGKKILNYLLSVLNEKKVKKVFLEVRNSNENAKKLYGFAGFEKVGMRPKYYCNEDAVLMAKNL